MTDSDWSDGQLRSLALLFSAVVEPADADEAGRHARLAAAALGEVADPADLRRVKLTLSALGSTAGTLAIAQRRRSLSAMSHAERESLLRAWSSSALPQRRTFFQLIKRLACFFAYADPGPDGANPRWPEIGYAFADEPVAETRPVERALLAVDRATAAPLDLAAEVAVVGSGAGGGVVAARLAEAGHDVLILEAAPYVAETDLPRNELDGFDRLYLDHGLTATTDLSVSILAGAAVGGGTLVNWTTCLEPPEVLRREWAHEHGLEGFDGADTDRHLARLRNELGFCAPPNLPAKDALILDGAAALGWEAAATQRNAADCGDCGACGFGCRRGAKRSGQRLHLVQAAGHGARLLAGARVDRVDIGPSGASGVTGALVDRQGSAVRPFSVRANSVVIAAGALRTPALLLRSELRHRELGAHLHLHPSAVMAARMPERVEMWRGSTQAARSLEHVRRGVLIESAPGHPGLVALALPWRGRDEMKPLMRDAGRIAPLVGITRDRDGGRVSVSRSGRARIDYRLSHHDADTARFALLAMARMARAGGADRLVALSTPGDSCELDGDERAFNRFLDRLAAFDFGPNRGTLFSAHQMGSARAGGDARRSACDPFGRVRNDDRGSTVRGLYVGDASLFPTALGLNPMVAVMAMAARVADTVSVDLPPSSGLAAQGWQGTGVTPPSR